MHGEEDDDFGDSLECPWDSCGATFTHPHALLEHYGNEHIPGLFRVKCLACPSWQLPWCTHVAKMVSQFREKVHGPS